MTGSAGQSKLSLRQMEEFFSAHRLRFFTADGQQCRHVALTLEESDFEALEQIGRFLIWAVGREAEIRNIGRGRRG